jgi:hypothetical protein
MVIAAGLFAFFGLGDQAPVVIQPVEEPKAPVVETPPEKEAPADAAPAEREEAARPDGFGSPSVRGGRALPDQGPAGPVEAKAPAPPREQHRPKVQIRDLELALTRELAHRGVTLDDLEHNPQIAPKSERWKAAHAAKNLTALIAAQPPLVSAIRTAPLDIATVRRHLDQVADRLSKASGRVSLEKLRPLEDRYLEIAKSVTPRTKESEAPALLAKVNTLLREVATAAADGR